MTTNREVPVAADDGADTDDYEAAIAPLRASWSPQAQRLSARLTEQFDFQSRLIQMRAALGLSQTAVGEIVGEKQSEISRMERGLINPSVARANRVLDRLHGYGAIAPRRPAITTAPAEITAWTAASYFLATQDSEDAIDALKLQKLLYYAQGYALALLRRVLFPEPILAWEYGPVVDVVWRAFPAGRDPLPKPTGFDPASLHPDHRDVLDRVYQDYGQFTAWRLRDMTHAESPWQSTPRNATITTDAIAEFFRAKLGAD
jgi:uncharacterized phage-associated protein/DNA-binding XRE family transcriptional regulator